MKSGSKIAYDYLANSIMKYEMVPGQAIVEQKISDLLGISRTPVREALKKLEADGFIVSIPGRGAIVKDILPHDVEEIFELRILLEEAALKSAVNKISDKELDDIEAALLKLDPGKNFDEYYNVDRELHNVIIRHSGNTRMLALLNSLSLQLERLRRISSMTPNRLAVSAKEHLAIIEAIKERDYEKARAKLLYHLNNVKDSTLKVCNDIRLQQYMVT